MTYGAVKVQFEDENVAKRYVRNSLNSENLRLFTMYIERRIVIMRVGTIHRDVRPEWKVATLVKEIKLNTPP